MQKDGFLRDNLQNPEIMEPEMISPTLSQLQDEVDQWIRSKGVRYFGELTNTALLMEEVGELARLMARIYGEQSFKESDRQYDLADEMADVLWVLVCLANQTDISLTEAFKKNMEKKNLRDADRHLQNIKLHEKPESPEQD